MVKINNKRKKVKYEQKNVIVKEVVPVMVRHGLQFNIIVCEEGSGKEHHFDNMSFVHRNFKVGDKLSLDDMIRLHGYDKTNTGNTYLSVVKDGTIVYRQICRADGKLYTAPRGIFNHSGMIIGDRLLKSCVISSRGEDVTVTAVSYKNPGKKNVTSTTIPIIEQFSVLKRTVSLSEEQRLFREIYSLILALNEKGYLCE